jgi:hypothetical protein
MVVVFVALYAAQRKRGFVSGVDNDVPKEPWKIRGEIHRVAAQGFRLWD